MKKKVIIGIVLAILLATVVGFAYAAGGIQQEQILALQKTLQVQ